MKIVNGHALEEWETVCPKCNGIRRYKNWECSKCLGFGYLDWVEIILGKSSNAVWYDPPIKLMKG